MIKSEIRNLLPEKLLNGVVRYQGKLYSFLFFIDKFYGKKMDSMLPEQFVNYLTEKYSDKTVMCDKQRYIKRVISELKKANDFEEFIDINETDKMNVEEELISIFENADEEFMIPWGNSRKSIYEIYDTLKKNKYVAISIEDKKEICSYLLEKIDPEIRNSVIEEMGLTVEEYVLYQLPDMMINSTDVMINNELIQVDEIVKRIVDLQFTRISIKNEELNRTKENPSLVTEISVELDKESNMEATLELPVILSDSEIDSFNKIESFSNEEKYYINQLRRISDAIKKVLNKDDLEELKKEFSELEELIRSKMQNNYINELISNITNEIIPKKEMELHIFKNNAEDYVDAIVGKIRKIKDKLMLLDKEEELLEVQNEINKLEYEIGKRILTDKEFSEANVSLMEVKMMLAEKQNVLKVIPSSPVLNHLVERIIELKKILLNMEYNSNKAETVGYGIKFEYAKSDLMNDINRYLEQGLLSEEDVKYLNNKMDSLQNVKKSVSKTKGGNF